MDGLNSLFKTKTLVRTGRIAEPQINGVYKILIGKNTYSSAYNTTGVELSVGTIVILNFVDGKNFILGAKKSPTITSSKEVFKNG